MSHVTAAVTWGWLPEYPRLPWSHRPLEMQMEDAPEFFYAGNTLRSTSRSGRMGHAGLYVPHLSLSFHTFASMFCISANPQCGNNHRVRGRTGGTILDLLPTMASSSTTVLIVAFRMQLKS